MIIDISSLETNNVFEFLDGREYTYEGVHGFFEYQVSLDRSGVATHRLYHKPSTKGKQSEIYKTIKRQLGDDYDTDMTQNIEAYVSIAVELGYED